MTTVQEWESALERYERIELVRENEHASVEQASIIVDHPCIESLTFEQLKHAAACDAFSFYSYVAAYTDWASEHRTDVDEHREVLATMLEHHCHVVMTLCGRDSLNRLLTSPTPNEGSIREFANHFGFDLKHAWKQVGGVVDE